MCVFLGLLSQKRTCFGFLDKKEWFWEKKSKVLKKSRKSKFSKGVSPWFLSKNRSFHHICFLGKPGQKTSFLDILDRKECFLDQSKVKFQTSLKNANFPTGLVQGFLSKIRTFYHVCVFGKLSQKRSLFDILDRKESLLD